MNVVTKTMSVAVLVTLGLTLTTWAAEPPKSEPTPDLDKLVGQVVDLSPWAYAWRAIGTAALPSMERVKTVMLGKGEADKSAAEFAKAIEETITTFKEK